MSLLFVFLQQKNWFQKVNKLLNFFKPVVNGNYPENIFAPDCAFPILNETKLPVRYY